MYRSPSACPTTFISNLKCKLLKLGKLKNKLIVIGGDTNIDLIQHETDTRIIRGHRLPISRYRDKLSATYRGQIAV